MPNSKGIQIAPAAGRLGILMVGMGAVASTFVAGVEAYKKNLFQPFGAVTQFGDIRIGRRGENIKEPRIKDFVPLADINDIVFGAWDIRSKNAYQIATEANVLPDHKLRHVAEELSGLNPMKAVFEQSFVKNLDDGDNIHEFDNKMIAAERLMEDIRLFKVNNHCDRIVVLCVASTEIYFENSDVHQTIKAFEQGLYDNHYQISPSMIYAYAAIKSGVPFINGTPNKTDIPALTRLANKYKVVICGKDFKTGQTLLKTVIAAMFKARALGMRGQYSTNILGNRDGLALDDPDSFKSKEKTKGDVLAGILNPEKNPELYSDIGKDHHNIVDIRYYIPMGDNKVGIDFINFFGWMEEEMILTYTLFCKDSILAAGLCLDLVLYMDLAQRAGFKGPQEWLSFYFKAPQTIKDLPPIHALHLQEVKLKNWLRHLMGYPTLDYLGLDY